MRQPTPDEFHELEREDHALQCEFCDLFYKVLPRLVANDDLSDTVPRRLAYLVSELANIERRMCLRDEATYWDDRRVRAFRLFAGGTLTYGQLWDEWRSGYLERIAQN